MTWRILLVDDEASARAALQGVLSDAGYEVFSVADSFKALAAVEELEPALVVSDLRLPGIDGIELTRRLRERDPFAAIVIVSAADEARSAVAALRAGAEDYLCKPLDPEELLVVVERALERRRVSLEASRLREYLNTRSQFETLVGSSAPIQEVMRTVCQVAPSRATVLVTGESGTGKELVARAVHFRSPRAHAPFVALHCAALSETLLESELFGHERGAFTGAATRREGRLKQADGGTLFLDEIGDISPAVQLKLLRVLQERAFERVGSNVTVNVDVRFVAATNRDLKQLVADGKFREDLWYRLNVVNIVVPPLRDRGADIISLALHFLKEYRESNGTGPTQFSDAALARLAAYSWPGNVRELQNVVERSVLLTQGDVIDSGDLPEILDGAHHPDRGMPTVPGASMEELERFAILKTVEATGGSPRQAARILGISVRKIQYRLQQYSSSSRPRARARTATLRPFRAA